MLASLTGMSAYVYVAIGVGGLVILAAIIWIVWFRSRQDFARGADAQKVETAEERVTRAEAETDLARRQSEIIGRDESRDDTARSLDDGTF